MSDWPTRDRMAVASIAHALAHAPIELVAAFAEGAERREG
jgi:hypothetical protein